LREVITRSLTDANNHHHLRPAIPGLYTTLLTTIEICSPITARMKLVMTIVAALVGLSTAGILVPRSKDKLEERQTCACYCGDGQLYEPSVADCEYYGGCCGCCAYICG
jgi:hypothetical protein